MKKKNVLQLYRNKLFSEDKHCVHIQDWCYGERGEKAHYHDFYEIVLVNKGTGIHVTERGAYPVFHGDVFFVQPGLIHTYQEIKNLEIVNILYTEEALGFNCCDLKGLHAYKEFFEKDITQRETLNLNAEQLGIANEIILSIRHEQKLREGGHEYFMRLGLMRLIGLICRSYSPYRHPDIQKLIHVVRFIERHCGEKIRVEDLAAIAGMSESSLLRAFREELNDTPVNYLLNLRLEKAAKKLRESTEQISTIAFEVGFHDSNYFSKMFSRKYNVSPSQYRAPYLHARQNV